MPWSRFISLENKDNLDRDMNQISPSFMALNWYSSELLAGRIAVVRNNRKRWDFNDLINHTVIIDGATYRCISVERFAHSPPWREGEPIGLLVEETPWRKRTNTAELTSTTE